MHFIEISEENDSPEITVNLNQAANPFTHDGFIGGTITGNFVSDEDPLECTWRDLNTNIIMDGCSYYEPIQDIINNNMEDTNKDTKYIVSILENYTCGFLYIHFVYKNLQL